MTLLKKYVHIVLIDNIQEFVQLVEIFDDMQVRNMHQMLIDFYPPVLKNFSFLVK